MGCCSSSDGGAGGQLNKKEYAQLLEHYTLGKVLGQGAFGVVYLCKKKGTSEEYAVKMIDKVESPLEDIKREVDMLKELAHPSVVKLQDVYYEKVFVCMVMDIYKGGDLIEGMQQQWKTTGVIPCSKMVHIARQMIDGIAWLHTKNCVHRDVKGDNYLMDRKDITDEACKVYLSDFGTVTRLEPGKRLTSSCGTQIYWPPEFFRFNYGEKVDVWAVGVVMYGLVEGKFPFKGEQDAIKKQVKLPSRCPPDQKEFILKLLEKDEAKRLSSTDALKHKWLNAGGAAPPEQPADPADQPTGPVEGGGMDREGGANAGVAERRRLLIDRLEQAKDVAAGGVQLKLQDIWKDSFSVADRRAEKEVKFGWWSPAKAKEVLNMDTAVVAPDDQSAQGKDEIINMLRTHNIDPSKFGTDKFKPVEDLCAEVYTGASRLMLDAAVHKKMVRVVDLVLLRVRHGEGANTKYLLMTEELMSHGVKKAQDRPVLVGQKKEPHENTVKVAQRIVAERLKVDAKHIRLDYVCKEVFETEEDSPSYPNVCTVYRKEILEGVVVTTDAAALKTMELPAGGSFTVKDDKGVGRTFGWMTEKACQQKQVKLRAPNTKQEVSALVQAPIGLNEDDLIRYLQTNNVDVSKFTKENGSKTLKEFSTELITGEATLARQSGGRVVRVVDVVIVALTKPGTGEMLLQVEETSAAGGTKVLNRYPAVKRRPDENQFIAAHRVLDRELKIDPNFVNMNGTNVKMIEETSESKSYPGLATIYKKRIITAELIKVQ